MDLQERSLLALLISYKFLDPRFWKKKACLSTSLLLRFPSPTFPSNQASCSASHEHDFDCVELAQHVPSGRHAPAATV